MTPDILARTGEALFGIDWKNPLAEALQVNSNTLRRWMNKGQEIPEGIADDLVDLIDSRTAQLVGVRNECLMTKGWGFTKTPVEAR